MSESRPLRTRSTRLCARSIFSFLPVLARQVVMLMAAQSLRVARLHDEVGAHERVLEVGAVDVPMRILRKECTHGE